ncbi:hypothetical protein HPB47_013189 [Ixodes persulcatus]|uniref:Uncharacterized protein n=1 Tax=Ixodes persulcatus TaxID=34615 RepID=A0AC60QZD0_IXOPE|nr:hypothetical protein HPB47_013189 [Ixodes persulcatus]
MDNGEPQEAAALSPASISSVAVRLPPYLNENPRVWFLQDESQFYLSGVTSQESKYQHVVSALSLAAADEVYDILAQPSATASYDQLKAALLQKTEASDRSPLQELLSAEELGDRCPSQQLRRMTQLLGDYANTIGDALLRELFIQRLPTNVQMVLATATALDLTGLAALADAVIEVATPPGASATSAAEEGSEAKPALPGTPSVLPQQLTGEIVHALHNNVDVQHLVREMLTIPARQVQRTSAYTIADLATTPGTAFFPAALALASGQTSSGGDLLPSPPEASGTEMCSLTQQQPPPGADHFPDERPLYGTFRPLQISLPPSKEQPQRPPPPTEHCPPQQVRKKNHGTGVHRHVVVQDLARLEAKQMRKMARPYGNQFQTVTASQCHGGLNQEHSTEVPLQHGTSPQAASQNMEGDDDQEWPLPGPYKAMTGNECRGVLYLPGEGNEMTAESLQADIVCKSHKVVAARPMGPKGNTILVTFEGRVLPKKYRPRPLVCFRCHAIGHKMDVCPKDTARCGTCGSEHEGMEGCAQTPKCRNCGGAHVATSKDCPQRAIPPRRNNQKPTAGKDQGQEQPRPTAPAPPAHLGGGTSYAAKTTGSTKLKLCNSPEVTARLAQIPGHNDTSPDLTWASPKLKLQWQVQSDPVGSNHLPIFIQLSIRSSPRRRATFTKWNNYRTAIGRHNGVPLAERIQLALKETRTEYQVKEDTPHLDLRLVKLWEKRLKALVRYRARKSLTNKICLNQATAEAKR